MFCSNRESTVSLLEGLYSLFAPFARECSREWRFYLRHLLQSRESCLAFGGFIIVCRSNRERVVSCLEGVSVCRAKVAVLQRFMEARVGYARVS